MRLSARVFALLLALIPVAVCADQRASTAQVNVQVLAPMAMPGLERQRTVRVYVPPGYARSHRRYAVLYMHDGQNLFDADAPFPGKWEVDVAMDALAKSRGIELIVVGIDHGDAKRIQELTPWQNPEHVVPEGREYLEFIVNVVKPYIDAHYRTKPDRVHTAIMGSSLGGLISHYAIFRYPDIFSKAGIFSPSFWYAPPVFEFTATHELSTDARLYFYAGGHESKTMVPYMQRVVDELRHQGVPDAHLRVEINSTAEHNEAAWRAEFPKAVQWLFSGQK